MPESTQLSEKKLIIQIPCLNEEETLPNTLSKIPRSIPGVHVEFLVINDGSTDRTIEVALANGVHHVLDLGINRGLAYAFSKGILEAARLGADYLVNLDADNQYNADDIPKILEPLQAGRADMVVGERPIQSIAHFSWLKKKLQFLGSWYTRQLSGTKIRDTPSGFRALNRKAMLNIYVHDRYTYTQDSLISASLSDLRVTGVPIRVNPGVERKSRLFKNMFQYIRKTGLGTLRLYLLYKPYPVFMSVATTTGLLSAILVLRFALFYITGNGSGWIQSLIIAGILATISVVSFMMAILSDMMGVNRRLTQQTLSEFRSFVLESRKNAR